MMRIETTGNFVRFYILNINNLLHRFSGGHCRAKNRRDTQEDICYPLMHSTIIMYYEIDKL